MDRRQVTLALATMGFGGIAGAVRAAVSAPLAAAVASPLRSEANRVRDRFRHPLETLEFWGLAPGMTVIEIDPSGGYWTEILAPYLKATSGRYVAAVPGDPARFRAAFSDQARWGPIEIVGFGAAQDALVAGSTADMVITARNIHDWMWTPGLVAKVFAEVDAALKPRGIFAVEEHRADPRPMNDDAHDGYVSTAFVVAAAKAAGLALQASSEINANPKDTKDYPFGVWTLPPTRRTHARDLPTPAGFDPGRYEAIGESDRMTLRFGKA